MTIQNYDGAEKVTWSHSHCSDYWSKTAVTITYSKFRRLATCPHLWPQRNFYVPHLPLPNYACPAEQHLPRTGGGLGLKKRPRVFSSLSQLPPPQKAPVAPLPCVPQALPRPANLHHLPLPSDQACLAWPYVRRLPATPGFLPEAACIIHQITSAILQTVLSVLGVLWKAFRKLLRASKAPWEWGTCFSPFLWYFRKTIKREYL